MRKKIFYFLTGIALAMDGTCAYAQNATVATVPEGMITFNLPQGVTSYFSLPLTNNEIYTSSVTDVTFNTISVGDAPAPFTTSLATAGAPYFVKFLSGNETGRVLLITANTTSFLTLDTTDHAIGSPILLTTTGYNVQVGDTFEIFPGNTLASVFGAGTKANPLVLTGGTTVGSSDDVYFGTYVGTAIETYYFNTTAGYWELSGSTVNANNTIIYPYSPYAIARQSSHPSTTFVLSGRVTPVANAIKVAGNETVYTSTQYATSITLSQLKFSNWVTGTSIYTADTLGVWNPGENRFDTYYQEPNSSWRRYPNASTNQSSFAIAAGTVITITKRGTVNSARTFLQSALPYSLD
jgi:uncharacterized protein (TIGR02597 family)